MTRLGIIINLETCCDLRSCMIACKREHQSFIGSHYVDVRTSIDESFPNPNSYFVPVPCQHCENPSCIHACPNDVFSKREDNIVVVGNTEVCQSCKSKACTKACPFGAIDLDPITGRIGKCDMCVDRIDEGKAPACVGECLTNSWYFGDLDDSESIVSQIIESWGKNVHQLKAESGNNPSVYYLLHTKKWDDMDKLYSPAWHNV